MKEKLQDLRIISAFLTPHISSIRILQIQRRKKRKTLKLEQSDQIWGEAPKAEFKRWTSQTQTQIEPVCWNRFSGFISHLCRTSATSDSSKVISPSAYCPFQNLPFNGWLQCGHFTPSLNSNICWPVLYSIWWLCLLDLIHTVVLNCVLCLFFRYWMPRANR